MQWQLLLAVLLSLHAGFAQAAMGQAATQDHGSAAITAATGMNTLTATDMAAMPCHGDVAPVGVPASDEPASADGQPGHKGCCDAGQCHCSAASAMPSVVMAVNLPVGSEHSAFTSHAAPARARAPDLRPPIR